MRLILSNQLIDQVLLKNMNQKDRRATSQFLNRIRENQGSSGLNVEPIQSAHPRHRHNLRSARVNDRLRAILYSKDDEMIVLYIDDHDAAYEWARGRRFAPHELTGHPQLYRINEIPEEVPAQSSIPDLFAGFSDVYLQKLGVPQDFLPRLRTIRHEDELLDAINEIPEDVAERLFALYDGQPVTPPDPVTGIPWHHPDVRRHFLSIHDDEAIESFISGSMARWMNFLHPTQRELVEGEHRGPVKVAGAAGTGKSVVALHRARHLARQGYRVLVTSFAPILCYHLQHQLEQLCIPEEQAKIRIITVRAQAEELVRQTGRAPRIASDEQVQQELATAWRKQRETAQRFSLSFVRSEWTHVIAAQGLLTLEEYRQARRTGRKRGLQATQRERLWTIFGGVFDNLAKAGYATWPEVIREARAALEQGQVDAPVDAVIVDEIQDLDSQDLNFLRVLAGDRPDLLMLLGDNGQRLYPGGYSLLALGIDVRGRGRSRTLTVNYRTTEQIRRLAEQVLPAPLPSGDEEEDAEAEARYARSSVLNGSSPRIHGCQNKEEEQRACIEQIRAWMSAPERTPAPHEIAVFARTADWIATLAEVLPKNGVPVHQLDDQEDLAAATDQVHIGTMHHAKGLEYKRVMLLGCDADTLPHPSVFADLEDQDDRDYADRRERRLLYVCMTRARDELIITWSGSPSPYLRNLQPV